MQFELNRINKDGLADCYWFYKGSQFLCEEWVTDNFEVGDAEEITLVVHKEKKPDTIAAKFYWDDKDRIRARLGEVWRGSDVHELLLQTEFEVIRDDAMDTTVYVEIKV